MEEINWLIHKNFYDNSLATYLLIFILLIILYFFKQKLSILLATVVFNFCFKEKTLPKKREFFIRTVRPIKKLIFVIALVISAKFLNYPSFLNFSINEIHFSIILKSIFIGIIISLCMLFILSILDYLVYYFDEVKTANAEYSAESLISFLNDFLRFIIYIIWLLFIIKFSFHQQIGNILTGLSIVGASIALATRESIENIIASFIIIIDKPFKVGDEVITQNITGTVVKIGMRSTKLIDDCKNYNIIPNKKMVDALLINIATREKFKKEVFIRLSINNPLDKIENYINHINENNLVEEINNQFYAFRDIQKNYFEIYGYFYIEQELGYKKFLEIQQKVNFELIKLINQFELKLLDKVLIE